MKNTAFLWISLCVCAACSDRQLPSPVPAISYKSITPRQLKANQDVARLRFEFTDGDGDIGDNLLNDTFSLVVRDMRPHIADSLRDWRIKLPELNSWEAVKGEISVDLPSLDLGSGLGQDSTYFRFYIFDKAGNKSNEEVSEWVWIYL